jgi:hypothetical protein
MAIGPDIINFQSWERVFQGAAIIWREGDDSGNGRLRAGIIVGVSRTGMFEITSGRSTAYVHYTSPTIVTVV